MIDLHSSYDATGSTDTLVTENNSNAVIPSGDGAVTFGVNPFGSANLIMYGAHVTAAAQALTQLGLKSNNLIDPGNSLQDGPRVGTITSILSTASLYLPYKKGPNLVQYANEAAGKTLTLKMDWVNTGRFQCHPGTMFPPTTEDDVVGFGQYTFNSGALTAGAYGGTAFSPTPTPPLGTYAVLGLRVENIATAITVRLQHADFGGAFPGFPVLDYNTGTLTSQNFGGNPITSDAWQGFQFVMLGRELGMPVCPVFRIQGQGTGLTVQGISTNTDTPTYILNLLKIA